MESLIAFRLLANKLHEKEFEIFIKQLMDTHSSEEILSCIFNHFYQRYLNRQNNNCLTKVTEIISNIIESRQETEFKSESDISAYKLTDLASSIFQKCSSYLDTMSFLNFATCSRFIYVSCYSPSHLLRLDADNNKIKFNLNNFPFLTEVVFSVSEFNKYIKANSKRIHALNHLKSLELNNESLNDESLHINTFGNCAKCIVNFSNIRYLECKQFGSEENPFNFAKFCEFLAKFPNLKELRILKTFLTAYDGNECFSKLLPTLQILRVSDPHRPVALLRNKLIEMYSHQLVRLTLFDDQYQDPFVDIAAHSIIKCTKLRHLYATSTYIDILRKSSQFLKNVECFCMDCWEEFDENEMKTVVNDIMVNCQHLNNFEVIIYYKQLEKMASFVEIGLFNGRENKKKEFVLDIQIWVEQLDKINAAELNLLLLRMVNVLNASEIASFAVIFEFNFKDEMHINTIDQQENIKQKMIDVFRGSYLVFCITGEKLFGITIKNKECKINGFRPSFIRYYDLND